MVLAKREKLLLIGLAAALGAFVLDRMVLTPYLARRDELAKQEGDLATRLAAADDVFRRQHQLIKVWAQMQQNGLKDDAGKAGNQVVHALNTWTQSAGASLESLRLERPTPEESFQAAGFNVRATGPMRAMARLLWDMETAAIPIRLTDVQISAQREGTEELTMSMGVWVLFAPPPPETAPQNAAPAANTEGQEP